MILHPNDMKNNVKINPNTSMNMIGRWMLNFLDLENEKVYMILNTLSYKFENILINGQKRTNVLFK